MSAIFVVTPIIAAWPLFLTAAAQVALSLGYTLEHETKVKSAEKISTTELNLPMDESVQARVQEGESMVLSRGDITIKLEKTTRGKCRCTAESKVCDETRLKAEGEKLLGLIMQKYARSRLVRELEAKGFAIEEEQVDEASNIHLIVRRFEP